MYPSLVTKQRVMSIAGEFGRFKTRGSNRKQPHPTLTGEYLQAKFLAAMSLVLTCVKRLFSSIFPSCLAAFLSLLPTSHQ